MRVTLRCGRLAAIGAAGVLALTSCESKSTRSSTSSSTTAADSGTGDADLAPPAFTKPVPEKGDETPAHAPPANALGGPYGHGKAGKYKKNEKTAAAPVRLTPAISDVALSGYLDTLNFDMARDNGELAFVSCAPPSTGCTAKVYIEPEIGMRNRDHDDIPSTGVIVARIINYSATETEGTYGIPPNTRAYWYVDSVPGGVQSRLFIRTPTSSTGSLRFLLPTMPYTKCLHENNGGPALGKFRKCVDTDTFAAGVHDSFGHPSNPFVRPVSFTPATPPKPDFDTLLRTELWVKCAQGCCVAGSL